MPGFYIGGNEVSDLYLGGEKLAAAYMGGELVFSATPSVPVFVNGEYNFTASDVLWSGNFANRQQNFRIYSASAETPIHTGGFWRSSAVPGTGNGATVDGSTRLPIYLFAGRNNPDGSGASQIWIYNGTTVADGDMPTAFSLTFTRGSNSYTFAYTLVAGSSAANNYRFYQASGNPISDANATAVFGTALGANETLRITVSNVTPSSAGTLELVSYKSATPFLTSSTFQSLGRRNTTSLNNVVLGRDTFFGHTLDSDTLRAKDGNAFRWDGLDDMGIRIRISNPNRYRWFGTGSRAQWDDVYVRFINKTLIPERWFQLDGRVFGALDSGVGGQNSLVEQGTDWTFDPYSDSAGTTGATARAAFMRGVFNLALNGGVVTGDNIEIQVYRRV